MNESIDPRVKWVTLRKAEELTGYSVMAFRSKIKRMQLVEDLHWRKSQDKRLLINIPNFCAWCEQ